MNIALDLRKIIDMPSFDFLFPLIRNLYLACRKNHVRVLIVLDDADPSRMIPVERKMESIVSLEDIVVSSAVPECKNPIISNVLFEETVLTAEVDFLIALNPDTSFQLRYVSAQRVGVIFCNIDNNPEFISKFSCYAFSLLLQKEETGWFAVRAGEKTTVDLKKFDEVSGYVQNINASLLLNPTEKKRIEKSMLQTIHDTLKKDKDYINILKIAQSFSENKRGSNSEKFLYIDVSGISVSDNGSGIPRFVNNMIKNLFSFHCEYTFYPVIADERLLGYSYATDFMKSRYPSLFRKDLQEGIKFSPHDVLLFLDPAYNNGFQFPYHQKLMAHGVRILQILHDLVPIRFPETTPNGMPEYFRRYCRNITHYDGIIANSKSTAIDYINWIVKDNNGVFVHNPLLSWFHMGSDLSGSMHTVSSDSTLTKPLGKRFTFLMVSTIEPRKNYPQALDAFDQLWSLGKEYNLVIVGREGWKTEQVINRLENHPLLHKKLFWYAGISDDSLSSLYDRADVVLMTSMGEGFGLALIEAAHYGKPLIVRDIPIFREIADGHAYFFKGFTGDELAKQIEEWMKMYKNGTYCKSDGMECLSWRESAQKLLIIMLSMITGKQMESVEFLKYDSPPY